MNKKQQLKVVIVGHVDHGKSTLIGRLLYDTGSLPENKKAEIEAMSKKRGMETEWSFLLDSFQAERDQAVTIDTTQIWFKTSERECVIIDAPGHREFLKNMISGAASADAAILVVDAEEGIQDQTKRHAYMLSVLGVPQVAVVINKMDRVDYDENVYLNVRNDVLDYLAKLEIEPSFVIPISARHGDGLLQNSSNTDWYDGCSLIDVLNQFHVTSRNKNAAFRFPIQDVYRFHESRILVGRIESGEVREGDKIVLSPSNEMATVTGVKIWPDDETKASAQAGEVIGLTLDKPLFAERGHVISHEQDMPKIVSSFEMNLFWLSDEPLKVGGHYKLRTATFETGVTVQSIDTVLNTDTLQKTAGQEVCKLNVAKVTFRSRDLIALDEKALGTGLFRGVLVKGYDVVGGGNIAIENYPDQRPVVNKRLEHIYAVDHLLDAEERAESYGHEGAVFWLTGLSGAGKSTVAMRVERMLHQKGYKTYVLDGDNVRHGLNSDLGFSPEDRSENIRRVGEVAALMADAGLIVITAFISPYREDRDKARRAAKSKFHEVFIDTSLEVCETRDPKGLYKKARDGEIKDFTGISSPYEAPENPDFVVNSNSQEINDSVNQLLHYIEKQCSLVSVAHNKEKTFGT